MKSTKWPHLVEGTLYMSLFVPFEIILPIEFFCTSGTNESFGFMYVILMRTKRTFTKSAKIAVFALISHQCTTKKLKKQQIYNV